MCGISDQIAKHCDEFEFICSECEGEMTMSDEGGYEILICNECQHKVWADGDEY